MSESEEIYKYDERILESYPDLIKKIINGNISPYKVEIHLPPKTKSLCWLNCKHCYTQSDLNESERISKSRLVEIIEEISNGNPKTKEIPKQLIFSGFRTDPLNSDYVDDILQFSKQKNFETGVHTKGLILKDKTIDILTNKNKDEDYVTFSVDSGSDETYNEVHGVKNSKAKLYSRVLHNVKNLVEQRNAKNSKLKIRATYLLTSENYGKQILSFAEDFSNAGVDTIRFSVPIFPSMGNQIRKTIHSEISDINLEEFKKMFYDLKLNNEKIIYLDFPSKQKRVLPCYIRKIFPSIGYDGYLYPCCVSSSEEFKELRIADLKKENFWESYSKEINLNHCKANCQCDRNSAKINKMISIKLNEKTKYHQNCKDQNEITEINFL